MKKTIAITTLIAVMGLSINNVKAASTEEDIGFLSGAVTGAAVGGPVGFFVGGIAGVLLGGQVEKANKLDQVNVELSRKSEEFSNISHELVTIKQQVSKAEKELKTANQWITEGLSLDLLFTTNSTELSEKDQQVINRLADLLLEYPELKIRLDGYADPRGKEQENYQLSFARAEAVQLALAGKGIDIARLITQAYGESQSDETNTSTESYALERRVSINFLIEESTTVAQN